MRCGGQLCGETGDGVGRSECEKVVYASADLEVGHKALPRRGDQ